MDKVSLYGSFSFYGHFLYTHFFLFVFQPSSSSSKPSHRSRSPLEDLIKCFCDACETFFKRKHVVQALKANSREILEDEHLREMLSKFLIFKQGRSNLKSETKKIVECYQLCDDILCKKEDLDDRRFDLEDACFTTYYEDQLELAVEENKTDDFLEELKKECIRRLAGEMNGYEYTAFQKELEKKLNIKWITFTKKKELNASSRTMNNIRLFCNARLNRAVQGFFLLKI